MNPLTNSNLPDYETVSATAHTAISNATATNPLSNIKLTDYDTVVATTQAAINNTMGQYLYNNPRNFIIYAIVDDNGDVTGLTDDPAKSNCHLKATISPERDQNGDYINIVDLNTDKGNQTISYNITMTDGEFYIDTSSFPKYTLPQADKQWVIGLYVDLSMQDVAKSDLPDDLKKQLENVDENMFSIQQLYMDLNTAALNSERTINFPAFFRVTVAEMMKRYLQQQQQTNKPLFGVSAKVKDASVAPPTFAPTYVDFCVTPYSAENGKESNPDLDTLNYLVMTNHNGAPKERPQSFGFNWVEDISVPGVMAIRRDLFGGFIQERLSPVLNIFSPEFTADGNELNIPTGHFSFIPVNDGSEKIAKYVYEVSTTSVGDIGDGTETITSKWSFFVNLLLTNDVIRLHGIIVIRSEFSDGSLRGREEFFNWIMDIKVYMDAVNNGQLDLKIGDTKFDYSSRVTNEGSKSHSHLVIDYSHTMSTLLQLMKTKVQEILPGLLKNTGNFIFPGGKTFVFKNPQFSKHADLVSEITYLS